MEVSLTLPGLWHPVPDHFPAYVLLSYEDGALMNRISALIRVMKEVASPFCSLMWGYKKKSAVCTQEEDPHQNSTMLAPWSWTSSLQNCEREISAIHKPSGIWYFVIAAQTKMLFLFQLDMTLNILRIQGSYGDVLLTQLWHPNWGRCCFHILQHDYLPCFGLLNSFRIDFSRRKGDGRGKNREE